MKVKKLNDHIEHITTGLKHQLDRYTELLELSKKLENLITAKDISGIEQAVIKKNQIIENLREIEESISVHKEAVMAMLHLKEFVLDKVGELINPSLREELEEQKGLINRIIREIIEIDDKNQEGIRNLMKDLSAGLQQIHRHFELQQAYLDRLEQFPGPWFFDHKK